ncbi:hypothetical protein DSM112329_02935 [Paraconexibacter sp. AEG42_29]|uniref:YtkA-like domain-containing protein n=1 Tax=Paraconexibacter sp. AEG42_29 TaxID=2997339 RepID=A0AAU7AWR5_9ACTN
MNPGRAGTLTVNLLAAAALIGCASDQARPEPQVHRAPATLRALDPSPRRSAAAAARTFMHLYLRAEVGRAGPRIRRELRALTAGEATRRAVARPRPTNRGFPPPGRLISLRALPVLTAGRWTFEARVVRGGRTEHWELRLRSTAAGPRVHIVLPTSPRSTP